MYIHHVKEITVSDVTHLDDTDTFALDICYVIEGTDGGSVNLMLTAFSSSGEPLSDLRSQMLQALSPAVKRGYAPSRLIAHSIHNVTSVDLDAVVDIAFDVDVDVNITGKVKLIFYTGSLGEYETVCAFMRDEA